MSRTPAPVGYCEDPSALLEAHFERIFQDNMQGLPIVNDALRVEAVGFEDWRGHWLGVLITPWFLNLMVVPGASQDWPQVKEGERLRFAFESGTYLFNAMDLDGFGQVLSCSLASPVREYGSQESVREVAQDLMRLIHAPAEEERGADASVSGALQQGAAEGGCAMSRRAFLRATPAGETTE